MQDYKFKLLSETVTTEDLFKDKTHDKIAVSLSNLILDEKKGITIGLEGSWGSGKSSIISMIINKIKKKELKTCTFQFDAWAHEGDYLRKIFLESFIDGLLSQIDSNIGNKLRDLLNSKKKIINNQVITKTITRKQSITKKGIFFSLSAILVPFGAALLSNIDLSKIWIGNPFKGNFYPGLFISIITSLAPLIVAIFNIIYVQHKNKGKQIKLFSAENWEFLQKDDSETIEQELSEMDERTSIEFEKYFFEILDLLFEQSDFEKLLIIIDNLDRVDSEAALNIWSTLQIFLQERNDYDSTIRNFDKVWIIVPYDSNGLQKIWGDNGDISKSFIDKSFQLRVDVPKPIFSGWENYTNQLIEQAIPTWSIEDKRQIIDVLHLTRKNLVDIPTPREIKNYINQLAYISSVWGNEFNISSIAYYVVWRELENCTTETIRENLEQNLLINKETELHRRYLSGNIQQDLSGLVFGVDSRRGYELLLQPVIIEMLKNNDQSKIEIIISENEKGFWSIFNEHILTGNISDEDFLKYSLAIYQSKINDVVKLNNFINILNKKNFVTELITDFFFTYTLNHFEAYIYMSNNIHYIKSSIPHFVKVINKYLSEVKDDELWVDDIIPDLSGLLDELSNHLDIIPNMKLQFTKSQFMEWCDYIYEDGFYNVANYVPVNESCFNELTEDVKTITNFTLHNKAFRYISEYHIKEFKWDIFITNIYTFFSRAINIDNHEVFNILEKILFNDLGKKLDYSTLKANWPIYNSFHHIKDDNNALNCIISGIIIGDDIQKHTISHGNSSAAGLKKVQTLWQSKDEELALEIIGRLAPYNKYYFIWELTKDIKNSLAFSIISIASKQQKIDGLFSRNKFVCMDYLVNFNNKFTDEDMIHILVSLIKNNKNINEEFNSFTSFEHSKELFYYIMAQQKENQKMSKQLIRKIKDIDKETWIKYLENNDYMLKIITNIREYDNTFRLTTFFFDAMCDFSDDIIHQNDIDSSIDKIKWTNLVNTLTDSKQSALIKHINNYCLSNFSDINMTFFELNSKYIDLSILENKFELVFEALISWGIENDSEIIEHIIDKLKNVSFVQITDEMKDNIISNYKSNFNQIDEELLNSINKLLEKMNIEIETDNNIENV